MVFFGLIAGASGRRPNEPAGVVLRRVADDDRGDQQQRRAPAALPCTRDQHAERHADVDGAEEPRRRRRRIDGLGTSTSTAATASAASEQRPAARATAASATTSAEQHGQRPRPRIGHRSRPAHELAYSCAASAATTAAPARAGRRAAGTRDGGERRGGQRDAADETDHVVTTPLRTRVTCAPIDRRRRRDAAVAALALLIGEHGLEQVPAAEVGPQRVGDVDLGVGDLPQQVVADAHLAARADQQIGIGLAGGVEEARRSAASSSSSGRTPASIARRAASTISARPP